MAKSQTKSNRKVSGKRYVPLRGKRVCDLGNDPSLTQIAKKRMKIRRGRGGNTKQVLLSDEFVYVAEKTKTLKLKIENVEQNPCNVNFNRRNIITKGCIVKTAKGNVKITSRPGQSGILQGVFL